MFNNIPKHGEESLKYDSRNRVILAHLKVFGAVVKNCLECLTFLLNGNSNCEENGEIYQTRNIVFNNIFKRGEESLKYDSRSGVILAHFKMFGAVLKYCLEC